MDCFSNRDYYEAHRESYRDKAKVSNASRSPHFNQIRLEKRYKELLSQPQAGKAGDESSISAYFKNSDFDLQRLNSLKKDFRNISMLKNTSKSLLSLYEGSL
jgi:hypothetical protein